MKIGDKVWYRDTDGERHSADVTRVISLSVVDLAVHDDNGCLVHGVTEAQLAKDVADQKTTGRWFPKS